jgi:hypothetical protein
MAETTATGAIVNRKFTLRARPVGLPKRTDFEFVREPLGEPAPGEVAVENLFLSLDPAMRGWMNEGRSYVPPVALGETMRAVGVGRVIASADESFRPGDHVSGVLGVQAFARVPGAMLTKVDPNDAPLPVYLSALGMPGMTAYFGLLKVGALRSGETVVISAATGAVGQVAGQIAKINGCRAIAIAGGPQKCRYAVDELGYDGAIDYKSESVPAGLAKHCPQGIDLYFDNVGGDILDACLAQLARGARVVICGAISQYNTTTGIKGPANYLSLLVNRARMEGFVVLDFAAGFAEAARKIAGWMRAGTLKSREDIVSGLETFPEALLKLYSGENIGKLVLAVTPE